MANPSELQSGLRGQLAEGVQQLGLTLDASAMDRLLAYLSLLARWNKTYNLTAVRDPQAMVGLHLLDSLAVLAHLPPGDLLDVGTGAGLPGMVIALVEPQRPVSLLDSNGKKTRFLRQVVRELRPGNVEVIEARCEALDQRHWSVVISRAFAALPDFIRLAGDCVGPGGQLLAMQAKPVSAEACIGEFEHQRELPLSVPGVDAERRLSIWRRRQPGVSDNA